MLKIRNYFIAIAVVFAISTAYALIGVQDAKAEAAGSGAAYTDLIKRIEALEANGAGNVSAGKIRGLNIGFDVRHRFEVRAEDFAAATGAAAFETVAGTIAAGTVAGERILSTGPAVAGATGRTNETIDFTLQRVRLTFDADINKNVRAFINLQDQRVFGEEGQAFGATGTLGNLGRTDLLEGYVEARNLGDLSPILSAIELRIGRWQAAYGNDRLIGTLNWTNQGRAYDGARVRWADKGNWVDLFAFQVEEMGPAPGGSSGVALGATLGAATIDVDEVLYGLYTHFKVYEGNVFEPYGIARVRSAKDTVGDTVALPLVGTGEQRYTAGFRLEGKNIPGLGGLDYTIEPAWQFGKVEGLRATDFSSTLGLTGLGASGAGGGTANTAMLAENESQVIQAHAVHAEVGYTFKSVPWTPRIGYAYSFASGDERPDTGSAKTFDHLYPTAHAHNGYMDMVSWQNIEDHQIHLSAKPTKKLALDLKVHFFELDEEADSWYNVAGGTGWGGGAARTRVGADRVLNTGTGVLRSVDETLGQEIDVTVKYNLFENFGIVAGYSHFFADDFIEDTGNGIDRGSDWAYFQTTVKF
jgi:hypothetical protein